MVRINPPDRNPAVVAECQASAVTSEP
jgi:hypothetical protein